LYLNISNRIKLVRIIYKLVMKKYIYRNNKYYLFGIRIELIDNSAILRLKNIITDEYEFTKNLRDFFEILGNSDRFTILNLLISKQLSLSDFEKILGKPKSSLSHHLKILTDKGYVTKWKKGKYMIYSLILEKFSEYNIIFSEWMNEIKDMH
jgi:DNA-binding transcriptional ArsR family regulator